MSDDKNIRGPRDRARINVNEDYEVRYWTRALNVTPEELERAVREVGTSSEAVRRHLGRLGNE